MKEVYRAEVSGDVVKCVNLTYFQSALKPLPKCLQCNKAQSRLLIVFNMIKKLLNSYVLLCNFQNKNYWQMTHQLQCLQHSIDKLSAFYIIALTYCKT